MENASKFIIIAGSVLIGVLILSVFVFVFSRGSIIPKTQRIRDEGLVVETFNNQFTSFLTSGKFVLDEGNGNNNNGLSFNDADKRYIASKELNNISDVVTAANLACSINDTVNNGYGYDVLEVQSSVEVIIDLGKTNFVPGVITSRYYLIEPNKEVKTNFVYGAGSVSENKNSNVSSFSTSEELSTYKLLENLRESKLTIHDNTNYTLYRYYFIGDYKTNKETGKIDSLTFTLCEDTGFDSVPYIDN